MATALATRITTAPTGGEPATTVNLTGIPVIVDKQKDLLTELNKAVGKSEGVAVVILWDGFDEIDPFAPEPRVMNRYTVTIFSRPILTATALAADDVMESILTRLWRWAPSNGHQSNAVQIGGAKFIPDERFSIYSLDLKLPN